MQKYQVIHFNKEANYAIEETEGDWLVGADEKKRERVLENLGKVAPNGRKMAAIF